MSTPTFQQFWDAYGLKRDRYAAERVWNRMTVKDRRAAIDGIANYRSDCLQRGISMMYGQGYLSHRRWEDEPVVALQPVKQQPDMMQHAGCEGQCTSVPDMQTW